MTSYRIRAAVSRDLESVVNLDRLMENLPHWTVAEYLAALQPVGQEATKPATSTPGLAISGTKRCLFVAEGASATVGFAVGKATVLESEVLAELESVAVGASGRRTGIGRALCSAVIEWSRRLGALEIELEVRSKSAGPIALYKGLGFASVGLRKDYYREPADDAVLMRLTFAS